MAKSYKYSVICVYDAGLIRVSHEASHHNSKQAAFRSLHHFKHIQPGYDRDFYVYDNEARQEVIEAWTYQNGHRVWF